MGLDIEVPELAFWGLGRCTGAERACGLCGVLSDQPRRGCGLGGHLLFIFGGFFSCIGPMEEVAWMLG